MFGLVEQNYELPAEVMEAVGFDVFKYEEFKYDEFKPEEFTFEELQMQEFETESLSIGFFRRGVMGYSKLDMCKRMLSYSLYLKNYYSCQDKWEGCAYG